MQEIRLSKKQQGAQRLEARVFQPRRPPRPRQKKKDFTSQQIKLHGMDIFKNTHPC